MFSHEISGRFRDICLKSSGSTARGPSHRALSHIGGNPGENPYDDTLHRDSRRITRSHLAGALSQSEPRCRWPVAAAADCDLVSRGYAGFAYRNISDADRDSLALGDARGVVVSLVVAGSAADRAALRTGDVITR